MQGRHEYQPELFSSVDIERLIPKGHLLRRIDRVLDLGFLHELTAPLYSRDQGRPSIDPVIFVRMVLLQALYDIDSDRQLAEEVGYNLAYRWFCRLSLQDSVPDHSSVTRIRDRLGEKTYQAIFRRVIEQCRAAGLVKGERILADGTYIAANASIYTMKEKKRDPDDDSPPPQPRYGGSGARKSKDGLSNNDIKRDSIAGKKLSNDTHYSPSDPDATLSGKHMEYKSLRYKAHHIADADSRVILDCHVTTGSVSEVTIFTERLEATRTSIGIPVKEATADRGYGSGENLKHLQEEMKIQTNIPLWSTRVGQSFFKEEGFEFDSKQMQVRCPAGHLMKRIKADKMAEAFVLPAKVCRACPRHDTCLSSAEIRQRVRGKKVRVCIYQDTFARVIEQERHPEFKKRLKERMWKMEGLFAEGKSHHGLRRARYRGRLKVQIQVYVISTLQNLKRLAAVVPSAIRSLWRHLIQSELGAPKLEKSWVLA